MLAARGVAQAIGAGIADHLVVAGVARIEPLALTEVTVALRLVTLGDIALVMALLDPAAMIVVAVVLGIGGSG